MYKDKILRDSKLLKNYKFRIISILVTVIIVVYLTVLRFSGHSHNGYLTKGSQSTQDFNIQQSAQGVNDGRKEEIDTSMDSKVIGSISKQRARSSNHAQFHHKDGQVDDINRHTIVPTTTSSNRKTFPTITPTGIINTRESAEPNSHDTKVVVLHQNLKNGAIKVVDRIDVVSLK